MNQNPDAALAANIGNVDPPPEQVSDLNMILADEDYIMVD
jgi:hypothetical protein